MRAIPPADVAKGSPLAPGAGRQPLPRFFAVDQRSSANAAEAVASLKGEGYWEAKLGQNSHPFTRQGTAEIATMDASQTHVGDDTDTSPFPDQSLVGISTGAYVRNMSVLIRALDGGERHTP